ncbi:MAG: helix-turn-helix domain-containing protein [Proteobacteria bacterium]|nr:helix-turn-helix domain-containing protein [Pseudomonadota bacterium]
MTTEKEIRGRRIRDIRNRLGLSQEQLGKKLGGVSKGSISGYESGDVNPTPEALIKLARMGEVTLDWILTGHDQGENPMAEYQKKNGEIAATIEPGSRAGRNRSSVIEPPSVNALKKTASMPVEDLIDESFSMSEMVTMTIEVLESKTVYRSALASNVRAFHQAVKMEGEMAGVKEEVQQMRAEHRVEMEELKEMIRSLGGQIPQKRDTAANS